MFNPDELLRKKLSIDCFPLPVINKSELNEFVDCTFIPKANFFKFPLP